MTKTQQTAKPTVQFTPKQLQELEKLFPALILPCTAPEAQLREYFGQQSVVEAVRKRVQNANY